MEFINQEKKIWKVKTVRSVNMAMFSTNQNVVFF